MIYLPAGTAPGESMIKKCIEYTINEAQSGCTVEEFLRSLGYSHRLVVHLRGTPAGLSIGGIPVYTIHRLEPGEILKVTLVEEDSLAREHPLLNQSGNGKEDPLPEVSEKGIVPVCLPLSIVYEDEDILIVNKDAGVPVHPSQGHHGNTLANAAAWYYQLKGEPFTYRAINRLDRDTSGLLILAKHMLSACILSGEMQNRLIKREYRALVCGKTPSEGTVQSPIARVDGSTIERQVDFEKGESACTHYRRISYDEALDLSYISLRLETGRTHQIRVHMKSIGHPLPGDFLYHPDYRLIKRQPLHSYRLDFIHPITGKPVDFTAALPQDMAGLV